MNFMIRVSFQTISVERCPAVALEIAYQFEHQARKFVTRIDRREFDVTREENKVYLWDRQRVPKSKILPKASYGHSF